MVTKAGLTVLYKITSCSHKKIIERSEMANIVKTSTPYTC